VFAVQFVEEGYEVLQRTTKTIYRPGGYHVELPPHDPLVTGRAKELVSHLVANWNPLLHWLGEVNLLKETLPMEAFIGQNRQFQADSPVPD